ncbi:MAG TPA: hypothetical protein GX522_04700 [Firmicutes bacterium]|jgi:hypothetical protein|nr:hypothetical protein [Bacillota bacterium]
MKIRELLAILLILLFTFGAQAKIMVNPYGYLPFAKKEALTTEYAENFELRNKESGRESYKNKLEGPLIDPETKEELYLLNFTEQVRGGDYFLTVGNTESPYLKIDARAFNPVFEEAMKHFTARRSDYGWLDDNGEENPLFTSYIMARGLAFYEVFSDRFADGELDVLPQEQNNKIPDFVDEMLSGARGLLKWYNDGDRSAKDANELTFASAVFALSGRTLLKADRELAEECSQIAKANFTYLQEERSQEIRNDLWLLFLAEMNLLTDEKVYEDQFRQQLTPVLETGWQTISLNDMTGLAISEMMKKALPVDDEIYDLFMGRSVGLLIAHDRDPYYRVVAFEPIETEFKGIYLTETDPSGLGSEGLYFIDVNEYYKTNTWVRAAQDQMHYLLGRNRREIDYLQDGNSETIFHIALLAAYFKDSSTMTRSGQVIGGVLKITLYFVLIFSAITLWQRYSAKRSEPTEDN